MAEGSSSVQVVSNGHKDIAKRFCGDSMMVEAEGRRHFQVVHLWTSSKRTLVMDSYIPDLHGPDKAGPCPKLPADDELIATSKTKEFLEIGLVFGQNPAKDMPVGSSANKARSGLKSSKEVMRRDDTMMRVFTPVEDYIKDSSKVFIGCKPENGRLNHFLGNADHVFYYPEFYEWIPKRTAQREYKTLVQGKVREAAARNKTAEKPTTAVITPDQVAKKLTAHPIVTTKSEHLCSELGILWELFITTGDVDYITAAARALETAHADLKYGPHSSTVGITAFMDFTEELADEEAEALRTELKAHCPEAKESDIMLIKQIHGILCKPKRKAAGQLKRKRDEEEPLGNELIIGSLPFFMDQMHEVMSDKDTDKNGDYQESELYWAIVKVLKTTEGYARHSRSSWQPSNVLPDGSGNLGVESFSTITACVRDVIKQVIQFSDESMADVVKHHGGLIKVTALKDILKKVGDTIDKATLQALFEQVSVVHAATIAHNNTQVAETLRLLDKYLGDMLLIMEKNSA